MGQRRVLFVGLDPARMDLTNAPAGAFDTIRDGIDRSMRELAEAGYQASFCSLAEGDPGAEQAVRAAIGEQPFDCVVIGAGLRLLPKHTGLFEALVNLVVDVAPDAKMALIDAGFPNKEQLVLDATAELGRKPSDLKHLVFTHHHPDHIGSGTALVAATGAPTSLASAIRSASSIRRKGGAPNARSQRSTMTPLRSATANRSRPELPSGCGANSLTHDIRRGGASSQLHATKIIPDEGPALALWQAHWKGFRKARSFLK